MFLRILLSLSVVLLSACSSVEFSPANSNGIYAPIVSPGEVQVFRSDRPSAPYKEIGLIHFKGASSLGAAIESMKTKAAAKGGNAVIDLKIIPGGSIGTVVVIQ